MLARRSGEDILEQLLTFGSSGVPGIVRIDGVEVAVILIHHFVGVMVGVAEGELVAERMVFIAASLGRAALRAKRVSGHKIRKMKTAPRNSFWLDLSLL
jgi:hypothetical protein